MDLSGLLHGLLEDPAFAHAARAEATEGSVVAPDAALPFLLAGMSRDRLVLAVTATTRQAEDLAAATGCLTGRPDGVAVLPAWETLPHERLSPSSDTVGRRLSADIKKNPRTQSVLGFRNFVVRPVGFEPATPWFVARCSIQLSYGRNSG